MKKALFYGVFFVLYSSLFSQIVTQETRSKTSDGEKDRWQISMPVGATGGLKANKDEKTTNATGLLGLQIFKENKWFISIFFNYAGKTIISGSQSQFGSFLLNPTSDGQSFAASGYRFLNKLDRIPVLKKIQDIRFGFMWRGGVAFSEWQPSGISESHSGQIIYGTLGLIFCTDERKYGQNDTFQFGGDLGVAFRWFGGELGQKRDFRGNPNVLGNNAKAFWGAEGTIFLKLNSLRPFIRFALFEPSNSIDSFSGLQVYLGLDILSNMFSSTLK